MNRAMFLDTSYFLALLRKRDVLHEVALEASVDYVGPFVTTDLVLVELANSLAPLSYRASAVAVIEKIRADNQKWYDIYNGKTNETILGPPI